ncbi:aspartyl/asparaginyl beta-hydroxylase domain-containing protein [Kangiella sp. HZ709]|uniref:aspartyl/asparaginyl beta-hydroxylase domain-containing protein n=1 Tax=Kangiella sp. HZ709 TaxID=2666328 RepID=UPI0012AF4BFA|nr:aspartyl/asparaginyl beta-hydroxylase domain-containing protein [Kangiella sp. HZ709]MRX26821.1 lipid A hydroxylase LpxO [Kangiella sp. HZ709]
MTAIIIISVFLVCTGYIHFRGKLRLKVFRQLLDHSAFFSPVNCLMYASSKVPNKPYVDLQQFPELQVIQDNWEIIREEALALQSQEQIKSSDRYNDAGFNSFFRQGWKRFYLKWYHGPLPSALKACPKTVELISSIPTVKAAMFAALPPGSKLHPHRDPYAGSLRYHLGLITPNSDDCAIYVDGEKYSWRDGEAVMFDETFVHRAENQTDENRIIFFCDIERPTNNFLASIVNKIFSMTMARATQSPNSKEDKTGFLNKIFGLVYPIRKVGKNLKQYNKNLYYLVKWLLIGLVLYAIIF